MISKNKNKQLDKQLVQISSQKQIDFAYINIYIYLYAYLGKVCKTQIFSQESAAFLLHHNLLTTVTYRYVYVYITYAFTQF